MTSARAQRTTVALAVVTVAGYLVSGFVGPHVNIQAGFIPARAFIALDLPAVPFVLTPLTATLLHGGILHIGFNVAMLVLCGRAVEQVIGGGRMLLLYGVGAYGAALAQALVDVHSTQPMIGASGAISALVAAYAMLFGGKEVRPVGPLSATLVRALWLLAAWTGIQWLVGVATGSGAMRIATAAHVGGFVTGLLLVRPLLVWRFSRGLRPVS